MRAPQHAQAAGQVTSLLRVAVEGSVELPVRQVAAITLKNLVRRRWDPGATPNSPFPLSPTFPRAWQLGFATSLRQDDSAGRCSMDDDGSRVAGFGASAAPVRGAAGCMCRKTLHRGRPAARRVCWVGAPLTWAIRSPGGAAAAGTLGDRIPACERL